MKSKVLLMLLVICFSNALVYATFLPKADINPNGRSKKKSSDCTATLSGNNCVGSVLTVTSSEPVASISWELNGNTILTQGTTQQNNGVVVAGGNGGGTGVNQLSSPNRLFVDAQGNLYIPDMGNNRVQKWTPGATSGVTVAGGNGSGSNANQFNRPTSVAVDAAGNVYVADQNNNRVQKWAPGATAGVTVATSLNTPTGVFIDAQGNLFVSQQNGASVLKFPVPGGTGIVVAGGNGYGSAANQLSTPTGIFVDAAGNLYICDTDNGRVQKWAPGASNGVTVARSNGSIYLGNPLGVFVDGSGNIYVTDYTGYSVQKWSPGSSTGIIIAGGNGSGTNPNQVTPVGVWMDAHNNLYVTDFSSNRVIKFANIYTGTLTATLPGIYTAKIKTTTGCEVVSNQIVVADNKVAGITITSSSNTVCSSFQPVFTANPVNGGTNPIFKWKINGIDVSGATNAIFSDARLTAGDVVTCELRSNEVCVQNVIVNSNPITLQTPDQSKSPSVAISANKDEICQGGRIVFSAQVTNAGANPVYLWKVNGNDVPDDPHGAVYETDLLNDLDEVSCLVTSDAPYCQLLSVVNSNQIRVKVKPNLTPTLTITHNQTDIYKGSEVTFQTSVVNGGVRPVFDWQVNGRSVGISTPVFTTTTLVDGDEVSCTMVADLVCTFNAIAGSNSIIMKVITPTKIIPPTAFSPNGDGINDHWQIRGISAFPNCKVRIFNRYGSEVFKSIGYNKAWEGDYNGKLCDPGIFYYVINLDHKQVISGSLMIMK